MRFSQWRVATTLSEHNKPKTTITNYLHPFRCLANYGMQSGKWIICLNYDPFVGQFTATHWQLEKISLIDISYQTRFAVCAINRYQRDTRTLVLVMSMDTRYLVSLSSQHQTLFNRSAADRKLVSRYNEKKGWLTRFGDNHIYPLANLESPE